MNSRAPVTDVAVAERPAESRRRANRARRLTSVPAPEPAGEQQPATEQPAAEAPRLNYGVDSVATGAPGAPVEGEAVGELPQPAAAPEPGISAEQVAQREAQVAAAQAALDSVADTPGLMKAFADAPPTVKAQVSGELGSRFDSTLSQDSQALQQETPELRAEMQGNTPAPAGQIAAPATDVTLEEAPTEEPAGEEIVGEPVSTEEEYQANDAVVGQLARSFSPEGGAKDIDRALDNVQTTDPSIVTSPGSAPAIPLEGETDPQRIQNQIDASSQQAQDVLVEQQAQAQALPGAERVQLADVHESYPIGNVAAPTAEDAPAPAGAQRYLELGQPAEVQTAFDDIAGTPMQESMAEARAQMDKAAQDRDQQHQDAVQKAERDTATAQRTAESDQRKQVTAARTEIETQRQNTVDRQQAAVTDVEQQANDRSADDRRKVDDRVRDDQQKLDDRYSKAEADSEAKVRDGERQAEEKRQRAERESEEQSWWEAALDFITDLFDALVSLINDIFDAVRAAVNAILDAVRDFALALIDLAAGFLKGLISAFGTFLKGLVQGLLGELFPELARKLIGLIDDAVELANSAIDTVANALKTAINAIVDVLQAGINALLNVFQAAVNIGLALARAALTGDWGAFIMQLIEAACRVAGLDPQAVFAFIGRTQETIQLIVDNPGQFLSNLVAALTGGIQRFADNFLTHLQAGIIGWLTGAIGSAGVTLPERFDLIGVISLVAQILGLTWQNLRLRLVRVIGERGVQVLEFVASYLQTLIEGGWSALWERIQNDLAMLRDMVLEQIRNFLVERLIMAAITRLATLFNPVGALVNILLAAYNFYTFIRDQLQRIMQVVTTVLDAIGNIARGVLGPAQERVESFLASLLPLALDLLARLIGLGNVGERVREILQSVQDTVWGAIDRLINWVVGLFRGRAGAAAGEPVAQGVSAAGAGAGIMGERVPIRPAEQPVHYLYITFAGRDATVTVESDPKTIGELRRVWNQQLRQLPNEPPDQKQDTARQLLQQLETGNTEAEQAAERQLAQAPAPASSAGVAAGGQATSAQGRAPSTASPSPNVLTYERNLVSVLTRLFELFEGHAEQAPTAASREILERWDYELRVAEPSAAQQLFNDLKKQASTLQNIQSWRQILDALIKEDTFYKRPLRQGTFASTVHGRIQSQDAGEGGNSIIEAFNIAKQQYEQRKQIEREARKRGYTVDVFTTQITPPDNVDDFIRRCVTMIHAEPARPPFSRTLEALRAWIVDRSSSRTALNTMAQEYVASFPLYYGSGAPAHRFFQPVKMNDSAFATIRYRYQEIAGPEFEVTVHDDNRGRTIRGTRLQLNWARSEIPRGSQGEREATYTENFDFNAAHLIADHFLGSGYRDSLNIVTTSTHYNQVVMQEVERKISEWIRSYRTDATSLRSVTFDMQVRATWGPPVLDDGILDQIRTQILSRLPANSPERQQFVADFAQTHRQIVAVGSAINRILSVEYHVQVHVDGVPKDAPREFRIGPDIYLGMDNEVLRRLFPRS